MMKRPAGPIVELVHVGCIYEVGHGTSLVGVITQNGQHKVRRFDTAITEGNLNEYINEHNKNGVTFKLGIDDLSIRWPASTAYPKGREMFVGPLATKHNKYAESGRNKLSRFYDGLVRDIGHAASAGLVKELTGQTHVSISLIVCVPYQSLGDGMEAQIEECYRGTHTFFVNDEKFTYEIGTVKVIREASAAAYTLTGEEVGPYATLDPGCYSTEAYVTNRNIDGSITFDKDRCHGFPIGMGLVVDYVEKCIQKTYDTDRRLTTEQREMLLFSYHNRQPYPQILFNRLAIPDTDLQQWVEEGIKKVAEELYSNLITLWKSDEQGGVGGDLLKIFVIGGGAYYLDKELAAKLGPIEIPENPELVNYENYAGLLAGLIGVTL